MTSGIDSSKFSSGSLKNSATTGDWFQNRRCSAGLGLDALSTSITTPLGGKKSNSIVFSKPAFVFV